MRKRASTSNSDYPISPWGRQASPSTGPCGPFFCLPRDRVGGGVTPAVLPHHRTYGSRIGLHRYWPAHPATPPLSTSCSSDQHFACGFLQIPPYDGHPCRSANTSPCRVCRGTFTSKSSSPPPQRVKQRQSRRYAPCLAHQQKGRREARPVPILPANPGQ